MRLSQYLILIIASLMLMPRTEAQKNCTEFPHYYATASDDRYFMHLLNLIGSIHKNDYAHLGMIAVFDLGMTPEQLATLQRIEKLALFRVEQKHPDLLTLFKTDNTRFVRGWFAWKPVIIKQALDMFPSIIYADAGTTILKPMDAVFAHIRTHGYFFLDTGHANELRITNPVIEHIRNTMTAAEQLTVFNACTMQLDAGFQGLSRAVYHEYVVPVYDAVSDLTLFADDGSAKLGFGQARHDQTLFSTYARKNGYTLCKHGWLIVNNGHKDALVHAHWDKHEVNAHTAIYRSRGDIDLVQYGKYIHVLY